VAKSFLTRTTRCLSLVVPLLILFALYAEAGGASSPTSRSSGPVATVYIVSNHEKQTDGLMTVQVRLRVDGGTANAVAAKVSYSTATLAFASSAINTAAWSVTAANQGDAGSVEVDAGANVPVSGDVLVATLTFRAVGSGRRSVAVRPGSEVLSDADNSALPLGSKEHGSQSSSSLSAVGVFMETLRAASTNLPFGVPALQLPWPTGQAHNQNGGYSYGCGDHNTAKDYYAIDFGLPSNSQVSAVANGVAHTVPAASSGGYGNLVWIDHANGVVSIYAHLNSFSVFNGQPVVQGQVIGLSGSTGNSTGPHLHFAIRSGATTWYDGTSFPPEPMSGIRGFGGYGLHLPNCLNNTSPFWTSKPPPTLGESGDINRDGAINVFDLSILLSYWGIHPQVPNSQLVFNADLNKNGVIDIFDLSILLSNYGMTG
jgi:murein DD-endopeptidase MepM/ murein hydrolase activator NlpD